MLTAEKCAECGLGSLQFLDGFVLKSLIHDRSSVRTIAVAYCTSCGCFYYSALDISPKDFDFSMSDRENIEHFWSESSLCFLGRGFTPEELRVVIFDIAEEYSFVPKNFVEMVTAGVYQRRQNRICIPVSVLEDILAKAEQGVRNIRLCDAGGWSLKDWEQIAATLKEILKR